MNLKKVKHSEIKAFLEETAGLEKDYISELIKSRRLAWRIAGASCFVTVIAVGAVAALTPMKTTETVVLRVNNASGAVDVIPTVKEKAVALSELEHKKMLQEYVELRQSYDWWLLQSSYDRVRLMSAGNAWADYDEQFEGPNALHEKLRDKARIETRIISITLHPDSSDAYTATVQFSTQQRNSDGQTEPPKHWIATISYTINPSALNGQPEHVRLQNPFGLQIVGYRLDPMNLAGVVQ